jgi:hypothetical protein
MVFDVPNDLPVSSLGQWFLERLGKEVVWAREDVQKANAILKNAEECLRHFTTSEENT